MSSTDPLKPREVEQPGTNGIWTFVFIDMIVFSLIFLVFLSEQVRLPTIYSIGQGHLDFRFGLANTLLLLTSSLFMAGAVAEAREGTFRRMRWQLSACILCGILFCLNKVVEYSGEMALGFTPSSNSFFSFYFFITGAHFLHVLGGMVFIVHCAVQPDEVIGSESYLRKLESTGLFWHFVDLLWIFIFPLLYLGKVY